LIPSEADWRALNLPGSLRGLYYLFRPIRLVSGYGLGLFKPRILGSLGLTAPEVVERMLELAEVGRNDVVYDLGCGDGRMPIMAAKRYGARGFGFDIDPDCVAESIANARKEGVDHLVSFKHEDATTVDVSPATVVMLFLPIHANLRLRSKLQAQLRPGARVVSHHWSMGDWAPLRTITVPDGEDVTEIHLWRIDKPGGHELDTVKH
jgi:SAM-dependent methyltransferase